MNIMDDFQPDPKILVKILKLASGTSSEQMTCIEPPMIELEGEDAALTLIQHGIWLRQSGYAKCNETRGFILIRLTPAGAALFEEVSRQN